MNLPANSESLGVSLGPALRDHCQGRLGPIEWFHNGWQHSGAATGFSTWISEDGPPVPVLVKLPVGPVELEWTVGLSQSERVENLPTPRVLAAGSALGNYELAWLVVERLAGPTLADEHNETAIRDLLVAVADFQDAAGRCRPVEQTSPPHEWEKLIDKARHLARDGAVPDSQRWNEAIKRVQKHLPAMLARWERRKICVWCHGDVHPGNALRRPGPHSGTSAPRNGAVLIDMALVHPGHWIEDALYLERLYWAKPELLYGIKPVSVLAQLRRQRGLAVDDSYPELAMLRRVLMAACAPAFLEHEGHPKYMKAALEHLERGIPQVAK
ncbi:MAG: hypothetical protein AMXMBFR58_18710 [Phycisphaerae bacterium]|nr:hypothetical protein [Phycisphaerales bacterium]